MSKHPSTLNTEPLRGIFRGYSMDKITMYANAMIRNLSLSELRWLVSVLEDYLSALDEGEE